MFAFERFRSVAILAMCVSVALISGCTEPAPTPSEPPPPALTAEDIAQEITEQERQAAAAEKVEHDTERRIQRNKNAVNDLMFLGMTVAEADDALGVAGEKVLSIGGGNQEHMNYEWKLEGDITIKATFINGKLDKREMVE